MLSTQYISSAWECAGAGYVPSGLQFFNFFPMPFLSSGLSNQGFFIKLFIITASSLEPTETSGGPPIHIHKPRIEAPHCKNLLAPQPPRVHYYSR